MGGHTDTHTHAHTPLHPPPPQGFPLLQFSSSGFSKVPWRSRSRLDSLKQEQPFLVFRFSFITYTFFVTVEDRQKKGEVDLNIMTSFLVCFINCHSLYNLGLIIIYLAVSAWLRKSLSRKMWIYLTCRFAKAICWQTCVDSLATTQARTIATYNKTCGQELCQGGCQGGSLSGWG